MRGCEDANFMIWMEHCQYSLCIFGQSLHLRYLPVRFRVMGRLQKCKGAPVFFPGALGGTLYGVSNRVDGPGKRAKLLFLGISRA